ncbi:MAG: serine protease [Gemmataceae bacterium]|nr:serine protease [Gemmataceae bacterium]
MARLKQRSLARQAEAACLVLGQQMYEQKLGEEKLRAEIQALGERIHSAQAVKGQTKDLVAQRHELLVRLARPALWAGPALAPGLKANLEKARQAESRLHAHGERLAQARAVMWPGGLAEWGRVMAGYAVVVAGLGLGGGAWWWLGTTATQAPDPSDAVAEVSKAPSDPGPETLDPDKLPDLRTQDIAARYEKSIALIRFRDSNGRDLGFGTGFLVRDGVLATNAHVIKMSMVDSLEISFPSAGEADRQPRKAKALLYEDKKRDLAFLSVDTNLPALVIAPSYKFVRGQEVTVIGNPGSFNALVLENAVSKGVMSSQTKHQDQDFYQLNIAVNPGNSGGPVFDSKGRVIGVITMKSVFQESMGFCVPCKDLNEHMAKALAQTPEDARKAKAQHDTEVIYRRLLWASRICSQLMRQRSFVIRNTPTPAARKQAIVNTKVQAQKNLDEMEKRLLEDVRSAWNRVGQDTSLSEEVRTKMRSMLDTYEDMRKHLVSDFELVAAYERQAQELTDRMRRYAEPLRTLLHEEEEEEFDHEP